MNIHSRRVTDTALPLTPEGTEVIVTPDHVAETQGKGDIHHISALDNKGAKIGTALATLLLSWASPSGEMDGVAVSRENTMVRPVLNQELNFSMPYENTAALERRLLKNPSYDLPNVVAEKLQDKNSDPRFRAASIILFTRHPDSGRTIFGTASLTEQDDQMLLTTVKHVARNLEAAEAPEAPVLGYFPGVGIMQLDTNQLDSHDTKADRSDSPVHLALSSEQRELLLAKKDVIRPLRLSTAPLELGDRYLLANPSSGSYIRLVYTGAIEIYDKKSGEGGVQQSFMVEQAVDEDIFNDSHVTPGEILNNRNDYMETMDRQQLDQVVCDGFSGSAIMRDGSRGAAAFLSSADLRKTNGEKCGVFITATQ